MGMADFYLKINFKKSNCDVSETVCQSLAKEKVFRIFGRENDLSYITLECKFDNFIPSILIAFSILYPFKENIESFETHGTVKEFAFANDEEFLNCVFSTNKTQLLSYYRQMGYLSIDSEKYYEKRNKLRKYYKKLKWS